MPAPISSSGARSLPARERAHAQRQRGAEHHGVVGDVVEGAVRGRAAEAEVDVGAVGAGERGERGEAPGCAAGRGQLGARESS